MRAVLLGSGTSYPAAHRAGPGIMVVGDGFCLLVDPSAGTTTRMARAGVSPAEVDAILVTHFHPDHVGDLIPFLFALRNPRLARHGARWPRLIGPPGLGALYEALRAPFGDWIPPADEVEIVEWAGAAIVGPDHRIAAVAVAHTEESLAYRITDRAGRSVACSGDTEECPGIVEIAAGADLLFLECSFPNGMRVGRHLEPAAACAIVRASRARRVVLTHFYPECDEVSIRDQLEADVRDRIVLGADLETYDV